MDLRREHLLAAARLPEEQHRRIGGRDLLYLLLDAAQRGALADHQTRGGALLYFLSQIGILESATCLSGATPGPEPHAVIRLRGGGPASRQRHWQRAADGPQWLAARTAPRGRRRMPERQAVGPRRGGERSRSISCRTCGSSRDRERPAARRRWRTGRARPPRSSRESTGRARGRRPGPLAETMLRTGTRVRSNHGCGPDHGLRQPTTCTDRDRVRRRSVAASPGWPRPPDRMAR